MAKKMQRKTSRPNRRNIERYRRFAEAYLMISNPDKENCFVCVPYTLTHFGPSYTKTSMQSSPIQDRLGQQSFHPLLLDFLADIYNAKEM
jgi:hypothetical protein